VRVFVAVHLTAAVQEALAAVQDRLRRAEGDVSWVKPGNLHATLKFLGEIEPARLDRIRAALAEAVQPHGPFSVEVAGIGTFGGRVPRVVWVGITQGAELLTALAHGVETALARIGFPREKRGFTAHLTLGRVRSPRNLDRLLAGIREEPAAALGVVPVAAIAVMQSELHPSGSIYTELAQCALGRSGGAEETPCE
jgi:2'-5' RNA ligase